MKYDTCHSHFFFFFFRFLKIRRHGTRHSMFFSYRDGRYQRTHTSIPGIRLVSFNHHLSAREPKPQTTGRTRRALERNRTIHSHEIGVRKVGVESSVTWNVLRWCSVFFLSFLRMVPLLSRYEKCINSCVMRALRDGWYCCRDFAVSELA